MRTSRSWPKRRPPLFFREGSNERPLRDNDGFKDPPRWSIRISQRQSFFSDGDGYWWVDLKGSLELKRSRKSGSASMRQREADFHTWDLAVALGPLRLTASATRTEWLESIEDFEYDAALRQRVKDAMDRQLEAAGCPNDTRDCWMIDPVSPAIGRRASQPMVVDGRIEVVEAKYVVRCRECPEPYHGFFEPGFNELFETPSRRHLRLEERIEKIKKRDREKHPKPKDDAQVEAERLFAKTEGS